MMSSSLVADPRGLWSVPGGRAIDAVVAGDFDGDGDQDLAASSGRRLAFLENRGNGVFAPARVQTLAVNAKLLATGKFDDAGGTGLLAVAPGVSGTGNSAVRTLMFNAGTRLFEARGVRTVDGVVRQVAVGNSFHTRRDMIFYSTDAEVRGLYLASATRLAPFPESAFSAPEGEEIAGIALRTDDALRGVDTRTLAVVTNTQSDAAIPSANVAKVYNVGRLEARLNPASSPIDVSPPVALHVFSGPSRLDSVLTGDLTGDGLSEIVVSGLLPSGGKPSQQLQVEYFDLSEATTMMGPTPRSVYSAGALNTPTGTPTLHVRAIGELNADGRADILAELRVPGAEGEANIRAIGLYQRDATTFDSATHSSEVAIPGTFPSGAGVLAAKLTGPDAGLSVVTLRTPGVVGPGAWSQLGLRRNTVANKRPVVEDVTNLGPTMTNSGRYLFAIVADQDAVRGQAISSVEVYVDADRNGEIDDADVLLGGFTTQTPESYPDQLLGLGRMAWYFRLPGSIVSGLPYTFLVRAIDAAGSMSSTRAFTTTL